MFKKTLESEVVKTINEYSIIKSKEQIYFDDGTRCGKAQTWYDVVDNECGDIVFSCSYLDIAVEWIENY